MKILILTDIHFGEDAIYKKILNADGSEYVSCFGSQFERLFSKLKEQEDFNSVDLVVNLGDSIADKSTEIDKVNLEKVSHILKSAGSEVVFALGNHDVKNLSFEEIQYFTDMPATYFSFEKGGVHHIILFAERYDKFDKDCPYTMGEKQVKWLEQDLENASAPVLVYMHFPLVHENLDSNIYFKGNPHRVFPTESDEVKRIITKSGKVKVVFSGHVHFRDIEKKPLGGVEYITAVSFSENDGTGKPFGEYLVVKIDKNNFIIETKKLEI